MQDEAWLAGLANEAGAQVLWWYLVGLVGMLAVGVGAGLLLQRRLSRAALPATSSGHRLWQSLLSGLGLGLALIAAAALVFAMLAGNLVAEASLVRFDRLLSAAIQAQAEPWAHRFFALVTHFGDTATLTVLCIAGAATLLLLRRPLLALGLVAAIGGNSLLNPALKEIFERTRPLLESDRGFDGWSFPSGHASGAVAAYGMLAYILLRLLPGRWHLPVILAAVAIAFSTGFSRIYLQAHYLSDVIAGFASGSAWLTVCIAGIELTRMRLGGRSEANSRVSP